DVRSPQEFLEFHIPGSINIPLFTDEEREIVGTIYTKESPEAAKQKGLALFSTKLPAFIAQFKLLEKEPVVYCWRGGMRSKTAATVDRKSTRLNSSHVSITYALFCLNKKMHIATYEMA